MSEGASTSTGVEITKITPLDSGYEVEFKHLHYWPSFYITLSQPVGIKKTGESYDIKLMDDVDYTVIIELIDGVIKACKQTLRGWERNDDTTISIRLDIMYEYRLLRRGAEEMEEKYGVDHGCDLMMKSWDVPILLLTNRIYIDPSNNSIIVYTYVLCSSIELDNILYDVSPREWFIK